MNEGKYKMSTEGVAHPLVSIIIRTKDRPKLLRRALESVAAQTYRPIEVVVVNDGGMEPDVEGLKQILGDIPLEYVGLEDNLGRAAAGNAGIEKASGSMIGFLDDDDCFYPEHVKVLAGFLGASDYKVAYADCEVVSLVYNTEAGRYDKAGTGRFGSDFSPDVLLFENYIPLISLLFDGTLLRDSGGFDESLPMFEDWDLLVRLSSGNPFYHISRVTSEYAHWSRDHQIANVNWAKARETYIRVLEKHSDKRTSEKVYNYYCYKDKVIKDGENELKGRQRELHLLKSYIAHKNVVIPAVLEEYTYKPDEALLDELKEKRLYIEEIHTSFGWRALEFYRKRVKRILAPHGSRRATMHNVVLKGVSFLSRSGPVNFARKVRNTTSRVVRLNRFNKEQYRIPAINYTTPENLPFSVSVVIPTKDAGNDFRMVLEKVTRQKGLGGIELIVVDSGSNDDTVKTAERFGAKVLKVLPSDFNHGLTRNFGAESASGDFIVFLSQDVIPIGEYCIHGLIDSITKEDTIAAASVRQVPRSDADMFACWQLWQYNRLVHEDKGHPASTNGDDFDSIPADEKRRAVQIDNIFSCFRKDVFDEFKFRELPYGEDLDIGIRMLKSGHKIAFPSSAGAVHSHNREAAYFMRRSFVDIRGIMRLLDLSPIAWDTVGVTSVEGLSDAIVSVYSKVKSLVHHLFRTGIDGTDTERTLSQIKMFMMSTDGDMALKGDTSLDDVLGTIAGDGHKVRQLALPPDEGALMNQYFDSLDSLFEYITSASLDISTGGGRSDDFLIALYKVFAVTSGSALGNYSVYSESRGESIDNDYIVTVLGRSV